MRVVSEADAIESVPALLRDPNGDPNGDPIVITDGEKDLRVIVSLKDYEIVRKAKVERFVNAAEDLGEEIRARAAEDGLTPEDLVKTLYPDATF